MFNPTLGSVESVHETILSIIAFISVKLDDEVMLVVIRFVPVYGVAIFVSLLNE